MYFESGLGETAPIRAASRVTPSEVEGSRSFRQGQRFLDFVVLRTATLEMTSTYEGYSLRLRQGFGGQVLLSVRIQNLGLPQCSRPQEGVRTAFLTDGRGGAVPRIDYRLVRQGQ